VDDETRPVSAAVRPTVQLLTAPSGFTLTAGGVLAVTHRTPWLSGHPAYLAVRRRGVHRLLRGRFYVEG
jgi:hypothetical protein